MCICVFVCFIFVCVCVSVFFAYFSLFLNACAPFQSENFFWEASLLRGHIWHLVLLLIRITVDFFYCFWHFARFFMKQILMVCNSWLYFHQFGKSPNFQKNKIHLQLQKKLSFKELHLYHFLFSDRVTVYQSIKPFLLLCSIIRFV